MKLKLGGKNISGIIFLFAAVTLTAIMIERLRLGLVRYFDADEFMYLNWAAHIYQGYRPYLDFLMHVTPVFPLILTPLFLIWNGITPVIAARIFAWFISIGAVLSLTLLFYEVRHSRLAIVAGIILAILPMPADKILEIRPDILAISLTVIGYSLLFAYFRRERKALLFWSGIFLGLGFLTMQKVAPSLVIGSGVLLIYSVVKFHRKIKEAAVIIGLFAAGTGLPLLMLFVWGFLQGNAGVVWYSIFRLPVEHLQGVVRFNQLPWDFFFLPNNTYYGADGISLGLVANHLIWIFALALAVVRLVSSIFLKNLRAKLIEITLACTILAYGIFYIWFSPLKFTQYLIPVAVFVSWYAADWIYLMWMSVRHNRLLRPPAYLLAIVGLAGAFWINQKVSEVKFNWTNTAALAKMQKIYSTIPTSAYLLDLEGRTIYYKYPHPVCCLAYGQFETYLSRHYPTYAESLEKTRTRFIYQAEIDRISALSPGDQQFMRTHYEPTENGELWVAKDW